jgi:hypothetical protein
MLQAQHRAGAGATRLTHQRPPEAGLRPPPSSLPFFRVLPFSCLICTPIPLPLPAPTPHSSTLLSAVCWERAGAGAGALPTERWLCPALCGVPPHPHPVFRIGDSLAMPLPSDSAADKSECWDASWSPGPRADLRLGTCSARAPLQAASRLRFLPRAWPLARACRRPSLLHVLLPLLLAHAEGAGECPLHAKAQPAERRPNNPGNGNRTMGGGWSALP